MRIYLKNGISTEPFSCIFLYVGVGDGVTISIGFDRGSVEHRIKHHLARQTDNPDRAADLTTQLVENIHVFKNTFTDRVQNSCTARSRRPEGQQPGVGRPTRRQIPGPGARRRRGGRRSPLCQRKNARYEGDRRVQRANDTYRTD